MFRVLKVNAFDKFYDWQSCEISLRLYNVVTHSGI